ncbi:hypothetical protein FSP39_020794 [Pinctada imbricata]|uniref:TNFR-Cys domain-containing protein n=1 Tax=Pinctada imbricata TaxID=66713 RepID=A0AA88Y8B1_PINIB|nr:hypothetical protein FSP39_020794 [Pinctada imbricata]
MAKRRPREKKKVWCDFAKKKYYFPQLAKCMKCDKCLKGEGHPILASEKDVKMDPVHGALNCLPCRTCPNGYFNPGRKFRCKQCRDCAGLGKTLVTPCNSTSNAVCGDTIHKG